MHVSVNVNRIPKLTSNPLPQTISIWQFKTYLLTSNLILDNEEESHERDDEKHVKGWVACFIGAIVLYVVALLLAPAFKFLCLFAGFGAGYLAYEFRKMLVAIRVLCALRGQHCTCWSGCAILKKKMISCGTSLISGLQSSVNNHGDSAVHSFPWLRPTTKSHADISAAKVIMVYLLSIPWHTGHGRNVGNRHLVVITSLTQSAWATTR